ncbi:MAG: hypothetical protein R3E12_09055 [Candidatus Eisenbacteria bacterium]
MNLVSELVLARNQILNGPQARRTRGSGTTQRLNLITTELQGGVAGARMQPIGNVWAKFPRVVRDLASTCEEEGRMRWRARIPSSARPSSSRSGPADPSFATRSITASNRPTSACSRGRKRKVSSFCGHYHERSGQHRDRRRWQGPRSGENQGEKAIITRPPYRRAGRPDDDRSWSTSSSFGFSTAAKVTNVSGRGVGMDVVKTNIEKIGKDRRSAVPRRGNHPQDQIPLTLAITSPRSSSPPVAIDSRFRR